MQNNPMAFAYWLKGFVELGDGKLPTQAQWDSIIDHLNLVSNKITPEVKTNVVIEPVTEEKLPTKTASVVDWGKIFKEAQKNWSLQDTRETYPKKNPAGYRVWC